jgi:hypothetical protein
MFTFLITLYYPKVFHRSDHLIRITEYHRKKLSLNPTSSLGPETRADFGFVTFVPVVSSPKQTTFVYCHSSIVLIFQDTKVFSLGLKPRTVFGVVAFVSEISSKQTTLIVVLFFYHDLLTSLPGLKEKACQVWCKFMYPFLSYKRTYTHTHIYPLFELYIYDH